MTMSRVQEDAMKGHILKSLPNFLEKLGLDENPMGLFYTDKRPKVSDHSKPISKTI